MTGKIIAFVMLVGGILLFAPLVAGAVDLVGNIDCSKTPDAIVCKSSKDDTLESNVVKIINTLIYMVGIISVVAIVYGGITYVTSNGSPDNINRAKSTILYAVIGIVVAILSFAIVNFVVSRF